MQTIGLCSSSRMKNSDNNGSQRRRIKRFGQRLRTRSPTQLHDPVIRHALKDAEPRRDMYLVTSDLFAKLPRLPSILRVGAAARTPLHRNLRADSIDAAHTWERRSFALQRFFNCRKRKNVTIFLAIELSLRHSLQCQPRSRSASTISSAQPLVLLASVRA